MTRFEGCGNIYFIVALSVFSLCCLGCMASKAQMNATLHQLYSSVGSRDPTLQWSVGTDFCEWQGIQCDTDGLITVLDLDYAGKPIDNEVNFVFEVSTLDTLRVLRLKGFMNPMIFIGIFYLIGLKELNFENSNFTTDLSARQWRTQLSSLEILDLRTRTDHPLLGDWIYCHQSLKTLRVRIISMSYTDPTWGCTNTVLEKASIEFVRNSGNSEAYICENFSNLRELDITTFGLTCIPPSIRVLHARIVHWEVPPNQLQSSDHLRELRIRCTESDPSTYREQYLPPTLEILEFNSCKVGIMSISAASALKELKLINMRYQSWADIDSLLALKSQLEVIDLSNSQIEGKLPDLTAFPQLKHLNLSGNHIEDELPSYVLPKLRVLDLSRVKLNGSIPTTICQYSELEQLLLSSNSLTGPIPSCFGETQPNLHTVIIQMNRLTGPIPNSLLLHPKLHTLNLALNEHSGTLPNNFSEAHELIHLHLTLNKLHGRLPSVLPKQMSTLDLSFNAFTGHINGSIFANLPLISLDLSNNQLEGGIPEELFTMPKLTRLRINTNRISGPIPEAFSQNAMLTHLSLSGNKLNGSIPVINCPCKELYLDHNELSGSLRDFPHVFTSAVEVLDLGANQLRDSFTPRTFPKLRLLRLSHNKFRFINFEAPQLIELYISNNTITNFYFYTPALQVLNMANNQIFDLITLLDHGDLKSLIEFDVSGNSLTKPFTLEASKFPALRHCNFSHNELTNINLSLDVAVWPIETIDISHNKLKFEFPFQFQDRFSESLRYLRNLHLNDNQIYGHISEMDITLIGRLHVLNLANNQMHGKINPELLDTFSRSDSKLSVLSLSGNRGIIIEKADVQNLISVPTLRQLSLSRCAVDGFPEDFSTFSALEILELAGSGLSGEIFTEAIRKLRLLRRLDLSSNDFSEMPSPQVWESLVGLEHIDLSGNLHLEGTLPGEFAQSGLRYIDVSNTRLSGSLPLVRSNVLKVARFANCSFSGVVEPFTTLNPIVEFDISNNQLKYFHSDWNAFRCKSNTSTDSDSDRKPFAESCNMRGNQFQCYRFPEWAIDCCDASCVYTEEVTYTVLGSVASAVLVVVIAVMSVHYGRRYLRKRRNEKSLEHLERSLLADAFDNLEQDMMIAWSDIKFTAKIGEGAFGIVYKGQYKGADVAVKALKATPATSVTSSSTGSDANEEYRLTLNELITEVRFLMKLKHPFIVLLMGASVDKGRMAIVLEYMHHGSLHDLLHKSKMSMDWRTKCRIAHQIACGMQYLHLQTPPVIHRDLKSMNILIDKNMTAKITDFGFSRENGANSMTSMVGTISYMAPEMFGQTNDLSSSSTSTASSSTAVYDTTCDIYSFGILMWEILTEQIPWHNYSQPMLLASVLNGNRPPIPSLEECVAMHRSRNRMNASTQPTHYRNVEMMDNDSALLLDFKPSTNNDSEGVQSVLNDEIGRYIEVMKQCWAQNFKERPNFTTIAETLEALSAK